jgi:hypothetical protein
VNVVLWAIYDVSAEMLPDVFRGKRVVRNLTLYSMVLSTLISEGLEEGAASRPRFTKND